MKTEPLFFFLVPLSEFLSSPLINTLWFCWAITGNIHILFSVISHLSCFMCNSSKYFECYSNFVHFHSFSNKACLRDRDQETKHINLHYFWFCTIFFVCRSTSSVQMHNANKPHSNWNSLHIFPTKYHLIFMKRSFWPCNSTTTIQPLRIHTAKMIHSLIIENYKKNYLSNTTNDGGRNILIFKDDVSAVRLLITITHLTNKRRVTL